MANITASMVKELREMTGAGLMDAKKALVECEGDFEAAKEFLRKKGQATANKKSSRETKEGAISISVEGTKAACAKVACETDFVARNDQFKAFIKDVSDCGVKVGLDNFMEKDGVKELFVNAISKLGENIVYVDGVNWDVDATSSVGSYVHSNGKIGVMVEISSDKSENSEKVVALAKDISMHIAASQVEALSEADLDPAVLDKERAFLIDQAKESGKPENIIEKMVEGRMAKFKKEICLLDQSFVKNPELTIAKLVEGVGKEIGCSLAVKQFYKSQI